MLHTCVERFDVMGGRENILGWDGEVNKAFIEFSHVANKDVRPGDGPQASGKRSSLSLQVSLICCYDVHA
jgi:hypothetical protein